MAFTFYLVLLISGGNDVIADKFHISLNAMTWAGRIGLLVVPPLAYYVAVPDLPGPAAARPGGAGPRRGDRHHPPPARRPVLRGPPATVAGTDDHGHPQPLEYAGWVVPKKMNRLGALAPAMKGFFFPIEKPAEAPVSPGMPPVRGEEREEITSGR